MPFRTVWPPRRLSGFAFPAAALAFALAVPVHPAHAGGATLSDSPLLSAGSPAERRCLADASQLRRLITIHTGRQPPNTSYSTDYDDIVRACQEGRYDDARDKQAVIWAGLALHQPHKS